MLIKKKISSFVKNKFRIILAIFAVVAMPFLCGCPLSTSTQNSSYKVNLEIWGTLDDATAYNEIFNQYRKINPYVTEIKYRKFSQATYKQELLDALASGQGPDIFMINNGWLPSFENKIESAPAAFISQVDMKNFFPDVVSGDFMSEGKVFAVPLSVDSMVLYYNKDLFNAAGITSAPTTWQEFDSDVEKLTKIDSVGNIEKSGAAIGTARNISQSADLLSVLMMQNGVELPSKKGDLVKFDEGIISSNGNVVQAGQQALAYYTKFAKATNDTNTANLLYTWNSKKYNSIDSFSEGSVGMIFNYEWRYAEIKNKNAKLNFAIAPMPQAYSDKPLTYANYWGFAVAKNKTAQATSPSGQKIAPVSNAVRTHEAWQFLRFMTLKNSGTITLYNAITKNKKDFPINFDPAADYLKKTQQPAARRDLIEQQKTDPVLGTFATGNLIAKHWYQYDPDAVTKIMSDMIESINNNELSLREALVVAKNKIDALQRN